MADCGCGVVRFGFVVAGAGVVHRRGRIAGIHDCCFHEGCHVSVPLAAEGLI